VIYVEEVFEKDENILVPDNNAQPPGVRNSFGDNFSGLARVNEELSGMHWDDVATSFSFPPVFEFNRIRECEDSSCGLDRKLIEDKKCIASNCLEMREGGLYYNNSLLTLGIAKERIVSVNLSVVDKLWYIGIVVGTDYDEYVLVYSFNGKKLVEVMGKDTKEKIEPKYSRRGGMVSVGGTKDDYIVLYSGYNGRAFRYYNNGVEDISRFFGLRVTNQGFESDVIRIERRGNVSFYILSIAKGNPRLIKMWDDEDGNSLGSIDLTPVTIRNNTNINTILDFYEDNNNLYLITENNQKMYELWEFIDLGFDNSQSRQIVSTNINSRESRVEAVLFDQISLEPKKAREENRIELYISSDGEQFSRVDDDNWVILDEIANGLFWKVYFKESRNKYYSPWFGHINNLYYVTTSN